jgi:hypothetical protein
MTSAARFFMMINAIDFQSGFLRGWLNSRRGPERYPL